VKRSRLALGSYWFFYFSGLGIFYPYLSLYLRENAGLSGTQLGLVVTMLPLVGLVAQPLWGYAADRTGARTSILALLTLGSAAGYALLAAVSGFPALLGAMALLALFATGVVPVSVSVTLAALRDDGPHAFGFIRVWGTIGYLVSVVAFPLGLDLLQTRWNLEASATVSEPRLELMFVATAAFVVVAALHGPFLPRDAAVAVRAARGEWRQLLRRGAVLRLLVFCFSSYLFLQGPMTLFPVYVRAAGGSIETVGRMWVLMLLLEVPLVLLLGTGVQRLGARAVLALGVLAGGLRWIVCGLTSDMRVLYPIQLLHGVVVAGLMLGGPLYLEKVVPENLRSTAQALLATLGVGFGGILSNPVAGWLLEHSGPGAPFLAGGVGAVILSLMVGWILPKEGPGRPSRGPVGAPDPQGSARHIP
jgi:PPP family 3-phenylpropionic acid transporter